MGSLSRVSRELSLLLLVHLDLHKLQISSLTNPGVFTDDEIDFYVEGEEKMTNDSFLSCLSLATFDGFLSASEVSLHCAYLCE